MAPERKKVRQPQTLDNSLSREIPKELSDLASQEAKVLNKAPKSIQKAEFKIEDEVWKLAKKYGPTVIEWAIPAVLSLL